MRFRTLALAVALACGLTATMDAKTRKPHTAKTKRTYKAQKYKAPKAKRHAKNT